MPVGFNHPKTCTHVRLLGPCFKTGRMKSYDRQQPKHNVCIHPLDNRSRCERTANAVHPPDNKWEERSQPKRACAATPLSDLSLHTASYNTGRSQPPPHGARHPVPTAVDAHCREMRLAISSDKQRQSIQIRTMPVPNTAGTESRQSIANSMRFPSNGFTYY